MRILIFIVRYKETDALYRCLESIGNHPVDIIIMNNYSTLMLSHPNVTIINNAARPDFSTGHLARNWNQALLHGFKNLSCPDYDRIICLQADAIMRPSWYSAIHALDPRIHFMSLGRGDEFQMFTPEGVRKVGLYDERFCNIGYHEADYFLRNVLTHPSNCVVNDKLHMRLHNPFCIDPDLFIEETQLNQNDDHIQSKVYHNISLRWFHMKWGISMEPESWDMSEISKMTTPKHKEIMLYPYFEHEIEKDVYIIFESIQ